jgi:hypothetical protein
MNDLKNKDSKYNILGRIIGATGDGTEGEVIVNNPKIAYYNIK